MREPSTAPRELCRHCDRRHALCNDGTFVVHGRFHRNRRIGPCRGSHLRPADPITAVVQLELPPRVLADRLVRAGWCPAMAAAIVNRPAPTAVQPLRTH